MSFEAALVSSLRVGVVISIGSDLSCAPPAFLFAQREKRSALIIGKSKVGNSPAYFYFRFYIVAAFNSFSDDR